MRVQMKPETVARRQKQHEEARKKSKAELVRRLEEKARQNPGGIWAELLAEAKSEKL